ncbi:MAG TPA: DsbA family protein [Solirubrobacteraceae bacterium]|nr:DsbA family protein [Solirubrobacteraceae bacterium]
MPAASNAFYFDLASPLAYLAAEQALSVFAGAAPVEWQPVLAAELPGGETFEGARWETESAVTREEVERRAAALGLQPVRWPEPFPFDSTVAMRAATYAKSIGRAVPFAQAAFRQAFAGGRSLASQDTVLIAAAACEMHPAAVLRAVRMRSVAEQLAAQTEQAAQLGVREVPAILAGERGLVFHGERALGEAAESIRAAPGTSAGAKAGAPGAGVSGKPRSPITIHRSR